MSSQPLQLTRASWRPDVWCALALGVSLALALALALALGACSGNHKPQVGGETHWLSICAQDSDCGNEGLVCLCGSCTHGCSRDSGCSGGAAAACFDVGSPLLAQRCESGSLGNSGSVCLATCASDRQCPAAHSCSRGVCLPVLVSDAAAGDAALTLSSLERVDASTSWSAPLAQAPLPLAIIGADPRLVGTWQEAECGPDGIAHNGEGCRRLVIEKNASGDIVGKIRFERTQDVSGPFAPASRADVGYPTELTPAQYNMFINPAVGVDYRLLDGSFADGYLYVNWNPNDLWHAWCQLQTPYLWTRAGHNFYFCAPQSAAAQAGMDEGKLVLCTSDEFGPTCGSGANAQPCACKIDGAGVPGPGCGPSRCACDSRGCDAAVRANSEPMRFRLEGDHLIGGVAEIIHGAESLTFDRVSP